MCPVGVRTSNSTQALETGVAKLWLLLVGVNQYQDEQIPGLHYSALDCQGLGEALNAATQAFPQKEVMIYHDFALQQPTLANVLTSLKQIAAASKAIDTVLFYFSGHGMLDPSSQQVVLCLQDTQKAKLIDTGLKLQEVLQLLENCSAQQQLLILDACHSGGMTLLGGRGEDPQLNPTPELVEVLRKRAAQRKGFYALLSCDRGQQSWEFPQLGHGVFTYYLIQGLKGEAADNQGVIEADGLYRYVYHQTLTYIDKANQQLRVINQLKKGRGDNSIHSEYPSQTPKRIVEGVGEVILGLKSRQVVSSRHPRQALVVEGICKSKTSLALSKILSTAGSFEVNYWTVVGKKPQSDLRKAIQKCLLSHSFDQSTNIAEAAATVLLYLRGQIQETEQGEAILVLSDDIVIDRSWLRKQLRRCRCQQIIIFDFPIEQGMGKVSVRDWVEELQIGLDAGQCLITAAVPPHESERFATTLLTTLNQGMQPAGLTAAGWITQLQLELAQTDIQLYFWLSGSQGIIEIFPGKTLFSHDVQQNSENIRTPPPDDLSSQVGIDYSHLRDLLQAQRWLDADQETTNLMLKVARREQQRYLDIDSCKNLPCTDLGTIDKLWVNYSHGRFGFSVQHRIWESIKDNSASDIVLALMIGNAKVAASETCIDFGNRVGWRLKDCWADYENLIWQGEAPMGHLPYVGFFPPVWRVKVLGVWEWHSAIATASWWELCVTLFSQIEACQIAE